MTTKQEMIDELNQRRDMYRALGGLYFNALSQEQIDSMAQEDYAQLVADENELISDGFNDIFRYLRKRNTGTKQELALDFTSAFLGTQTYLGWTAAPYESLYTDPSGTLMGPVRMKIFNLYKAERVAVKDGLDVAEDHLSFECEFMAIIIERTAKAIDENDMHEADRLLSIQHDFMENHINLWFKRFRNIALKLLKTRFYRGVLKVSEGFFFCDIDTIEREMQSVNDGLDEEGLPPRAVV